MLVCQLAHHNNLFDIFLAEGELGKDVEFVAALDSQRVPNPSESLLRDWAMEGGVTVADLLEILDRASLERKDIIEEVRAAMQQQDSNI